MGESNSWESENRNQSEHRSNFSRNPYDDKFARVLEVTSEAYKEALEKLAGGECE